MSPEITIPSIVRTRLKEAEATPSIPRWSSLRDMCASMVKASSDSVSESPMVGELRRIERLANTNVLAMQPQREEAA